VTESNFSHDIGMEVENTVDNMHNSLYSRTVNKLQDLVIYIVSFCHTNISIVVPV